MKNTDLDVYMLRAIGAKLFYKSFAVLQFCRRGIKDIHTNGSVVCLVLVGIDHPNGTTFH